MLKLRSINLLWVGIILALLSTIHMPSSGWGDLYNMYSFYFEVPAAILLALGGRGDIQQISNQWGIIALKARWWMFGLLVIIFLLRVIAIYTTYSTLQRIFNNY